jgi:hypothetical protein
MITAVRGFRKGFSFVKDNYKGDIVEISIQEDGTNDVKFCISLRAANQLFKSLLFMWRTRRLGQYVDEEDINQSK